MAAHDAAIMERLQNAAAKAVKKAEDVEAANKARAQSEREAQAINVNREKENVVRPPTQRTSLSQSAPVAEHDPLGASAMLEHVKLYRQLQANWQSYDAYARVAMSMGTNQLLHALTYYVLGYLIMEAKAPVAAYGCAAIFTTTSILLARLDLYLHRRATFAACGLLLFGPLLAASGTTLKVLEGDISKFHRILIPMGFLIHLGWIVFILGITRAQITDNNVALPTTFRSVLYLDVFGW